jgi:hypothetical protein
MAPIGDMDVTMKVTWLSPRGASSAFSIAGQIAARASGHGARRRSIEWVDPNVTHGALVVSTLLQALH